MQQQQIDEVQSHYLVQEASNKALTAGMPPSILQGVIDAQIEKSGNNEATVMIAEAVSKCIIAKTTIWLKEHKPRTFAGRVIRFLFGA